MVQTTHNHLTQTTHCFFSLSFLLSYGYILCLFRLRLLYVVVIYIIIIYLYNIIYIIYIIGGGYGVPLTPNLLAAAFQSWRFSTLAKNFIFPVGKIEKDRIRYVHSEKGRSQSEDRLKRIQIK